MRDLDSLSCGVMGTAGQVMPRTRLVPGTKEASAVDYGRCRNQPFGQSSSKCAQPPHPPNSRGKDPRLLCLEEKSKEAKETKVTL